MTIGGIPSLQGLLGSERRPRTTPLFPPLVRGDTAGRVSEEPGAALASIPLITVSKAKTLGASGKASPSQIFEPWIADAHERRRANRKVDSGANRQPSAYRSKLDKEAETVERPAPPVAGRTGAETKPSYGMIASGRPTRMPADERHPGDAIVSTEKIPGAGGRFRTGTKSVDTPNASNRGASTGEVRVDGARPANGGNMPVGPTAGIRPGEPTGADGPVAQRVARILGAARSSAVEAIRTTAANQADGNGRTSLAHADSAGRAAPSRRSGITPNASQTNRVDSAGRSEFDKLVRSLRMQVGARRSSAKIHLDPPELGRLFVDVRLTDGNVQVDIRTETEKARTLLHERADLLRAALEKAGLHIDRFEVRANLTTNQPPVSAGGYDRGDGADLPTRSDGHAPSDGGGSGAAVPRRDDGVASVESERDEVVPFGMERRLDLRI